MGLKSESVKKYKIIMNLRDQLKQISQLSWNITQFENKYPFKDFKDSDYEVILKAYEEFFKTVTEVNTKVQEILADRA